MAAKTQSRRETLLSRTTHRDWKREGWNLRHGSILICRSVRCCSVWLFHPGDCRKLVDDLATTNDAFEFVNRWLADNPQFDVLGKSNPPRRSRDEATAR